MSHTRNLRMVLALCVVAVAAMGSPSAQAGTVCNEAGNGHHNGTYIATDSDPSKPARYQDGLSSMGNGEGKGHDRAAERSPALSQCEPPSDGPQWGGGGGGDDTY